MKKKFYLINLISILIFSCGYKFPDQLPEWKDINSYSPEKLEFQKTSLKEYRKFAPDSEIFDIDNDIKIINIILDEQDVFNEVNVGFKDEILDWIEFSLNKEIKINEFVSIYGFPRFIDKNYSDIFNYYNYETFNIAVDKNNIFAKSISIFDTAEPTQKKQAQNKGEAAESKSFFQVFPGLKPGLVTEEEFIKEFPDLLPYMEGEFDVNSCYTFIEELGEAKQQYQKAILKFENGLLSWINLIPVNSELEKLLKKTGKSYKTEKLDENYDFYVFDNFVLVVNRAQKKVNSIGVFNYDKSL